MLGSDREKTLSPNTKMHVSAVYCIIFYILFAENCICFVYVEQVTAVQCLPVHILLSLTRARDQLCKPNHVSRI